MTKEMHAKFVASLTFRGFEVSPDQVESLVGVPATELGTYGAARKPGLPPLQRSFARWEVVLAETTSLDEMIPALLSSLGGTDRLHTVQEQVRAEFLEVDLSMWIKDSIEQEGGFIDPETIAMLARLGATLSFGFYSRNAENRP